MKETSTASTSKQNDNRNEQPLQCVQQIVQPIPSFVYVPFHQMNSAYLHMQNYYLLPQQPSTTTGTAFPVLINNKRNRSDDNIDASTKCCVNNGNVINVYNNYLHNSYNQ